MKVEHLDHIHIAIKDIDKAAELFERLLGIKFCKEGVIEKLGLKWRIAIIGGVGIELLQGISKDDEITKFVEKRGEGVQAISFKVTNLKEEVDEMKAMGIWPVVNVDLPLLREVEFHPKDTHGVQIELAEYKPGHPVAFAAHNQGPSSTVETKFEAKFRVKNILGTTKIAV